MRASAANPADPTHSQQPGVTDDAFIADHDAAESGGDEDDDDAEKPKDKKAGRRKIKIEFIQDKSRRHITFSKRKAGTQVLLLVVSETGLVYTFTTAKLQPLVTQPEGKNLIQACLNAPHGSLPSSMPVGAPLGRSTNIGPPSAPPINQPGGLAIGQGPPQTMKEDEDASPDDDESVRGGVATVGTKRRRRGSSNAGPAPPPPPAGRGGGPTSPHSPNSTIPPPLSIPPGSSGQSSQSSATGSPQIALGNSPTSPQQGHAVPPNSSQYSPTYSHPHPHTHHPSQHPSHQSQGEGGMYGATPAHMIPGSYAGYTSQQTAPGGQQLSGLATAAAQHGHWTGQQQQQQVAGQGALDLDDV
ncbi:transcription factor of the MADS box [Stygiomarasmius scandens]|uniref:Transcription factor of the MADS box n=1 Tax=Marasmiellus scandens TaxID=2682957 RepID=A0ABR1JYR1_9AGAR